MPSFAAFFRAATGNTPYDYQSRLAFGEPDRTSVGKTARHHRMAVELSGFTDDSQRPERQFFFPTLKLKGQIFLHRHTTVACEPSTKC